MQNLNVNVSIVMLYVLANMSNRTLLYFYICQSNIYINIYNIIQYLGTHMK